MVRSVVLALVVFCATTLTAAEVVENTSYVLPNGDRVLRHAAVIRAPVSEVWKAFTTTEGFRSFAAPVAEIDLRVGGVWEASYRLEAKIGDPGNIQNELLSYLPERMVSIKVRRTPLGFPHPEIAKSVHTVILFDDAGGGMTRVSISMFPWKSGTGWDDVHRIFEGGNAIVLQRLQQRFETGPINWPQVIQPPRKE